MVINIIVGHIPNSLKNNILKTKDKTVDKCLKTFKTNCMKSSIYKWFLEKYHL